jgi:hypothetical protein
MCPGQDNLALCTLFTKEKMKTKIEFRTSLYEKKLIKIRAKNSGLTVSEFCRRSALDKKITQRLTDDQVELYKILAKYHTNFISIGNMFRKRNPELTKKVYELANEIKEQLKKFQE